MDRLERGALIEMALPHGAAASGEKATLHSPQGNVRLSGPSFGPAHRTAPSRSASVEILAAKLGDV
jgi:hypothetical protein